MKFTNKIIGLLIAFMLIANVGTPITFAAALSEPEKACADKKPDYEKLMNIWNEAKTKDQNVYKDAFEEAQMAHHDYVGCMFQFAIDSILQSEGGKYSGMSIPIINPLLDWTTPDQACLTSEELKKVILKTNPSQMLGPMLKAHTNYRDHLQKLGNQFDRNGVITGEDGKPVNNLNAIVKKSANLETVKRRRQLEIETSLLAIDLMFTSLKELRLSFVMHVHFQCTLKYLNKYRQVLEDLRDVIEPLPVQLEDASTS